MNERQTRALNNLYAATVEVMNAFAPEMVTAEMRRETVARMLDNFLSGMNGQGRDIGTSGQPVDPTQPDRNPEPGPKPEPQPVDPPQPPVQPVPKGEERYSTGPVDGVFKRLKDEEGRKELLESDPDMVFFYKFYITGETGRFELAPLDGNQVKELVARASELLDGVTDVVPDSEQAATATRVVTVQPGEVVKNGRSWEITSPAKIKYIS